MAERIHRITMFKLPKVEDQQSLLEKYKDLVATNSKDGKPYILSTFIGPAEADPRSQGFTLVSKTEFASMEDMKYYDEACPAHQRIKDYIRTLTLEGMVTVYFKPQVVGSALP
ncbi:Fusaristatin A biosynthesis cluster protein [Cladobotryum mycophilum]|uniref:Fusaristatin A biosynthesis cluster protein n=1 Tax=Cladobotryum mycophilum TaxID=491253 RepID=A0ABR0SFW0_9HYPO